MKHTGLLLIVFGTINIIFPDFIAYIIGGVSVIVGILMLIGGAFGPKKPNNENHVKFGNYKIFR